MNIQSALKTNISEPEIHKSILYKSPCDHNVDVLHQFQKDIYENLSESNKSFFLLKTKSFLKDHFQAGGMAIALTNMDNQLVAQALIVVPSIEHPNTGMTDMKAMPALDQMTVLQGVAVDPQCRGHGLGDKLVNEWVAVAHQIKRPHLVAETAQDNIASVSLFEKHGVDIVSEGIDMDDGTKLYNHHRHLGL